MLLAAGSLNCGYNLIIMAEARGLREGVRVVINMGFNNFVIEEENAGVINVLKKEWMIFWEISCFIKDTEMIFRSCNVVRIVYYFREVNMVVNFLVKMGTGCLTREDWW